MRHEKGCNVIATQKYVDSILPGTSGPQYNGCISKIPVNFVFAGKRQITHLGLGVKQARCMCFWLPLEQTDRNTCLVSVTNCFSNFV